jgi:molybdopterin molybdotransferase
MTLIAAPDIFARQGHRAATSQPGDCCSAPATVSVDAAMRLILAEGAVRAPERVPLGEAGGRILASPIVARRMAPTGDVAAMDGYAVRDADLTAAWNRLTVIGESFAGHGFTGVVLAGSAVRVFTGAPVPVGADRVIVQEDTQRIRGQVAVPRPSGKRHIRSAGSDFAAGDVLVDAGVPLTPGRLVAAAAADIAEVIAFARPKVTIVATGDELRTPGADLHRQDSVPESVTFGIAELARIFGGQACVHPRLPDDLDRLQAAAGAILEVSDIVVITGGASVGERDYARAMFARSGLRIHFSKVSMRPGKPVWFGRAGRACILGLPGNPTAAMVTARLFLAPLIAAMAGRDARTALGWRSRPIVEALEPTGPFDCFLGASLAGDAVSASANRDSSAQRTLAATDTLIRRRAHAPAAAPGDLVETLDF